MKPVYILGGSQSDFARNWTKEGKHFVAVMREAVTDALADITPMADLHASADYRRRVVQSLAVRAITGAPGRFPRALAVGPGPGPRHRFSLPQPSRFLNSSIDSHLQLHRELTSNSNADTSSVHRHSPSWFQLSQLPSSSCSWH